MKLQKQLSRVVKGKEYPKFMVVIPPKQIAELGWEEGVELGLKINGTKLVLEPKKLRTQ